MGAGVNSSSPAPNGKTKGSTAADLIPYGHRPSGWMPAIQCRSLLQVRETHYPKPSIWLSPSVGVGLGGAVTFRCRGRHQNMRFLLYKAGNPAALQDVEPAGNTAKFAIHSAGREDAGSYSCRYRTKVDPPVWSEPSDPVELGVAGEGCPCSHPHTSEVGRGGAVTIHCRAAHHNVSFLLYKAGNPNMLQGAEPAWDMAEFPLRNVSQRDGGSYSCQYGTKANPPVWSELSDPVELTVVGEGRPHSQPHAQPDLQGTLRARLCRAGGLSPGATAPALWMHTGVRVQGLSCQHCPPAHECNPWQAM
uniref:Ig-like domain-containing protein n=1 Tax=Pelusios castaneus TaxID=367368 RepID=A0A8C8SV69_9SAUR